MQRRTACFQRHWLSHRKPKTNQGISAACQGASRCSSVTYSIRISRFSLAKNYYFFYTFALNLDTRYLSSVDTVFQMLEYHSPTIVQSLSSVAEGQVQ